METYKNTSMSSLIGLLSYGITHNHIVSCNISCCMLNASTPHTFRLSSSGSLWTSGKIGRRLETCGKRKTRTLLSLSSIAQLGIKNANSKKGFIIFWLKVELSLCHKWNVLINFWVDYTRWKERSTEVVTAGKYYYLCMWKLYLL